MAKPHLKKCLSNSPGDVTSSQSIRYGGVTPPLPPSTAAPATPAAAAAADVLGSLAERRACCEPSSLAPLCCGEEAECLAVR